MEIREVKELLEQFDQSSLTEFSFKKDTFDLYMNKNKIAQNHPSTVNEGSNKGALTTPQQEVQMVNTNEVSEKSVNTSIEKKVEPKQLAANLEEIVSPIVGVVYLKPAPDKENFKQVGDTVKKGEVICIIEAMKLMNEITSTADGVIAEILVDNESIVEYNQPLITVAKGV
ncbi:acetyl-CoA carboxylase biotin carboxyl carrier protein [Enterococcus rivorum]|uniref:Biotin carboxyl carrier protein of acetyl-CoA carboxylase n=1 Tax=Enterococcus rivorum TaxID=762845 RepID=A0A1E5KU14_9ENTE|nr:acetyl-CoA carboxylase biotin carboxyl carrier protein [Enterococcus rivorum]MBP2100673.1 acetyl-CoA carboxylase biotin carboxyl carrier protein [Enterococcus rivorum]OEH81346.1 acetyl-CoA carboxylase, biotin carboxyl carrier protein [Enterococcus rivorum]